MEKGVSIQLFYFIALLSFPMMLTGQNNCSLLPEIGPCFAAITKYYFNQATQKCEPFTWGGCDGVVPFHTKADCQAACELTVGINELSPQKDKKLKMVLNILGQKISPVPNTLLFYIYEDGSVQRKMFIE